MLGFLMVKQQLVDDIIGKSKNKLDVPSLY